MRSRSLSRRGFLAACGAAAGTAIVADGIDPAPASASLPLAAPDDTIQLNSNENPYGLSRKSLDAFNRSAHVGSRYPDGSEDETRKAIASSHGVSADRIVLGCGSSDILRMADAAFLGGGKTVIAAEPTFEAVLLYAGVMQASATKVPLTDDFRHDLAKMAAACDRNSGLVYVCNPNNPTGTVVSADAVRDFLAAVPQATTVLVDEAYHHFVEDPSYGSAIPLVDRYPNLVVARTFSKIYGMAGLRLGYAVASEETAAALGRQAGWNNTNGPALAVALAALRDAEHVPAQRRLFSQTRTWLCDALRREGRRYIPSHTNFLMIHVGSDVAPIIRAFRERKILVGRKFPSMPDWLRVSIGRRTEMEAFLAALREVVPARAAA
jgi:histidinol-phosphate aminotransferase